MRFSAVEHCVVRHVSTDPVSQPQHTRSVAMLCTAAEGRVAVRSACKVGRPRALLRSVRPRTLTGPPAAAPTEAATGTSIRAPSSGKDVVEAFYAAYNARDIAAINQLIAEDISYHDLVYSEPHEGRKGVMAWLQKVRQYAPDDLKFVIEDITDGDPQKVGVKWHVECGDGIFFPFSRGCSFIKLDNEGRIVEVRDVVEPAFKPGDSTLELLGALTPLIRAAGPAAHPDNLPRVTAQASAAAVWALYIGYISAALLSSGTPGAPIWATPPAVLEEVFNESLNIYWINEALTNLGVGLVPLVKSPPVSEGLFNFVLLWALMFAPVIFTDGPSQKVKNKGAWFTAIMFITNIFFIPFMALRAGPEPPEASTATSTSSSSRGSRLRTAKVPAPGSQQLPGWSRALGALGMGLGGFCFAWALWGRPEWGDMAARWAYFQDMAATNRVFWAFLVDMALFYTWQLAFLEAAPARFRLVPFFGLAGWLLNGGTQPEQGSSNSS